MNRDKEQPLGGKKTDKSRDVNCNEREVAGELDVNRVMKWGDMKEPCPGPNVEGQGQLLRPGNGRVL